MSLTGTNPMSAQQLRTRPLTAGIEKIADHTVADGGVEGSGGFRRQSGSESKCWSR